MEIAILITNYNNERFVLQCLDSVSNQSYQKYKVFIIDDCSNDNSLKLISSYVSERENFHLFVNKSNLGGAVSNNILLDKIQEFKFDFVCFLDSDDYWEPDKLYNQIELFKDNPNIEIISTEGNLIYDNNHPKKIWGQDKKQLFTQVHRIPPKTCENSFDYLLGGSFIFFSSVMLRINLIKKFRFNNLFSKSRDWIFLLNMVSEKNYFFINKPLANYRIHGSNISSSKTNEIILSRLYVINKYNNQMNKKYKSNHYYACANITLDLKEKNWRRETLIFLLAGFIYKINLTKFFSILYKFVFKYEK